MSESTNCSCTFHQHWRQLSNLLRTLVREHRISTPQTIEAGLLTGTLEAIYRIKQQRIVELEARVKELEAAAVKRHQPSLS